MAAKTITGKLSRGFATFLKAIAVVFVLLLLLRWEVIAQPVAQALNIPQNTFDAWVGSLGVLFGGILILGLGVAFITTPILGFGAVLGGAIMTTIGILQIWNMLNPRRRVTGVN